MEMAPLEGGPLFFAVWSGDVSRVKRLLAEGCNPDDSGLSEPFDHGQTPLMEAVSQPEVWFGDDEAEIVQALLKAGADANRVDSEGGTALHYAVGAGPRAVRLLLNAGADPNARTNGGRSPLFQAIEDGLPAEVEALLGGGADPDLPDESGVSPRRLVESLSQPDEDQILIREIIRRG